MGKMKNGILDAFSGTIGRVVGTSWRGVAVMRSKAHSRKNANSPKQQEQKAKFKVAADFTQTMHDLLTLGFRDQAVQMRIGKGKAPTYTKMLPRGPRERIFKNGSSSITSAMDFLPILVRAVIIFSTT